MGKLIAMLLALMLAGACAEVDVRGGGNPSGGMGDGMSAGGADSSLRNEKLSDAALGAHEAIFKATIKTADRTTTQSAIAKSNLLAGAATDNRVSHDLQHSLDHNRRLLLKGGPGGQPGAATYGGGADSLLRPEKISDAALGTHESIQTAALKLADRKSIQHAARDGAKLAQGAADPAVTHADEHGRENDRRLLGEGRTEDIGAMDGAMLASSAILKAVNVPTKGSAKFATARGVDIARTVTNPAESRFKMNAGEPLHHRRLLII